MLCVKCHRSVNQIINGVPICSECDEKQKQDELRAKEDSIRASNDFKGWKMSDMSELFWIHLGIYQKEPNKKSLLILKHAYLWAVHANKGLANSFCHAMEWIGIKNIAMACSNWDKQTKKPEERTNFADMKNRYEKATIKINQEDAGLYADLLSLTGNQAYGKYGLKRDETYSYVAKFPGNVEMAIKLVICGGDDRPYTEAVLFKDGCEVAHTDCSDKITGTWELEYEGVTYQSIVSAAT